MRSDDNLLFNKKNHLHMNAKFNSLLVLYDLKVLTVEQATQVKGGAATDEDKRRNGR
jgi:hypothetical protein